MNAATALLLLQSGNERYVSDQPAPWRANATTRQQHFSAQKPFACIVTCSDSRVPPEILFDCSLGEIFVVRVAGTVQTPEVIGSVEFAVSILTVPLVVVMAHSGCGAIEAAAKQIEVPERVAAIIDRLAPMVTAQQQLGHSGDNLIIEVSKQNTRELTDALMRSRMIRERSGTDIEIHRAFYDMKSGRVLWDF
jgi:carbonic anhydrase